MKERRERKHDSLLPRKKLVLFVSPARATGQGLTLKRKFLHVLHSLVLKNYLLFSFAPEIPSNGMTRLTEPPRQDTFNRRAERLAVAEFQSWVVYVPGFIHPKTRLAVEWGSNRIFSKQCNEAGKQGRRSQQ